MSSALHPSRRQFLVTLTAASAMSLGASPGRASEAALARFERRLRGMRLPFPADLSIQRFEMSHGGASIFAVVRMEWSAGERVLPVAARGLDQDAVVDTLARRAEEGLMAAVARPSLPGRPRS